MSTRKPDCGRCKGTGYDPAPYVDTLDAEIDYDLYTSGLGCITCYGTGIEDPYDGDDWLHVGGL